ncbi:3-deoxy-7-phosphoheptulonate synthase [Candidatus Aerophobetes bacterium]|uniref:Phospho-2-dehydro-3-deoxyheptonate aldolase n=1 Tax=Aerophobetes bacterium TaxID=2030807 RepID=A0A2A4X6X1_UNCAE|nr:MAG: 3-deoxy-7-phosphoheptulonate synthase [Candidatus Aerophobetes bacterium]
MYQPLITPKKARSLIPISASNTHFVDQSRKHLQSIMQPLSTQLAIGVGPCSIHQPHLAIEYAKELKAFSKTLSGNIKLYMRVFFEKPRTQFSWKGLIHDPDLDESYALEKGILTAREILKQITDLEVPIVTELLDPHIFLFVEDFISWGMIGSRTCYSQIHRQLASHVSFPMGFKNAIDGSFSPAIHGATYAAKAQKYIGTNIDGRLSQITSPGNKFTHLVLRGGEKGPNFDENSINAALELQEKLGLRAPTVVDCSHGNARTYKDQIEAFKSTLQQIASTPERHIFGLMLESHLKEGRELSLTDPCLGLDDTFALIKEADHLLTRTTTTAAAL